MKYIIYLPNPYNLEGPWIEVAQFNNEIEAKKFVEDYFGGTNGTISLISEIDDSEEDKITI